MDLTYVLALLTEETRQELASLATPAPVESKAPALRRLSRLFQALGICTLLIDADTQRLRENLVRSIQARCYHLRKAREEGSQDRFQGLSKVEAIFDAIVAGAPDLLAQLVSLSTDQWHEAWEYEDDFCYYLFVYRFVTVQGFLASDESATLITRFEKALQGQSSSRLDLCVALRSHDAAALREALEHFLAQRKVALDTARARMTEYTAQAIFWPQSFVSIEALAWLALADIAGMPLDDTFVFCPPEARRLTAPLPPIEDFFVSLDRALAGEPE